MAILIQSNGFQCTEDTYVATPKVITRFKGFRVMAVASEDSDQVQTVLRIIAEHECASIALLTWIPVNTAFWVITTSRAFLITRLKDQAPKIVTYDTNRLVGKKWFIAELLTRLRIGTANALFLNELIHGKFIRKCKCYQTTSLGLVEKQIVPPMLAVRN